MRVEPPHLGATMTETEPTTEPELSNAEYYVQWRELERQFPPPTWDEVQREWQWLHENMANGAFDPEYKYGGLAVAIFGQRVVGTDVNWLRLVVTKSRELGVHPERLVVTSFLPL